MPNLNLLRIPRELQERKQWAVATLTPKADGKPDKAPRNPITGSHASSTDPSTWCTFEEAINSGYPAIGYMLTANDPFTIIDLDDKKLGPNRQPVEMTPEDRERQVKVYETFDSYAERSQSGKGAHIIVRAKINGGTNRDGIEVYDQERFMICTGDVIRNAPVNEYNALINAMVEEMGGLRTGDELPESLPEREGDDDIIRRAENAKNGDKFKDLFYRAPQQGEDWSQRDASLAQFIAFYTRNHDQALRLFRRSALYRPNSKGKNPAHYEQYYLLERTFGRAWNAEKVRDADIEHGKALAANLKASQAAKNDIDQKRGASTIRFPAGLVGEVANFIYHSAQRPVPEIALAGALAFCSGLFGRQYNVSNTGLNLYIVLLAPTGRGKESAAAGIDMLMSALRTTMPAVDDYRGPGHIASGQALVKHLNSHPACFAFLSEFGHLLQIVTAKNANAADLRTKQVLLDLFGKSGQRQMLHSSIYSDQDKNTKMVQAPCFAFMGDTTPGGYYDNINEKLINEGLVPRFLTISYEGPRVPKNPAPVVSPSPELVERLTTLFTSLANMFYSNTFVDIRATEEANEALDRFDLECDNRINGGEQMAEMWNRAHLKVLRLAGIVAVGKNHFEPVMDLDDVSWAIEIVTDEINRLEEQFKEGRVGDGEIRQDSHIADAVRDYIGMDAHKRSVTYKVPKAIIDRDDVIPYSYFRRRLKNHKAFRDDRRGMSNAIKQALKDAVDMGVLQELSEDQRNEINFASKEGERGAKLTSTAYVLGPSF